MMRLALFAATLASAASAVAQLPETRLGTVFPPGGQIGTTFEVRISGERDLEYKAAPRLLFSHPGITAEPVVDPATGLWRDKAFRVTAGADVPAGRYDVFLVGDYGVSNPRSFLLGRAPSTVETADRSETEPATLAVNVPCYGRITFAADVDSFSFVGEAGATVVIRCEAARLDSPLQPVIELAGPDGRRIAVAGGAFGNEAVLPTTLPAAGNYQVRLTDAAYRGGDEFVYRIEAATRPVVASVRPAFGEAGTRSEFTLLGYNLPQGEPVEEGTPLVRQTVAIELPADPSPAAPPSGLLWSHQAGAVGCGRILYRPESAADPLLVFSSSTPPEIERDNDGPAGQAVSIPTEVAGRFEQCGDADRFLFDAQAGEVAYVEVFAKRYGSNADPVLTIDQTAGPDGRPKERRIAVADDLADNIAPGIFDTATDDPTLRFEAPEDGRYRITLRDRYSPSRGDESLFYRLSLRRPQPDFQLFAVPYHRDIAKNVVSPDAVSLRKGESVEVPVFLMRRDGFNGPVHLTAENLPVGLSTKGAVIPEGRSNATLVLTASRDAAEWEGPVAIVGEATLPAAGRTAGTVRHAAHVGTVVRGAAGGRTESRLTDPLFVSILEEALPFRIDSEGGHIRAGQGGQVLVPLELIHDQDFAETVGVTVEGLAADAKVTTDVGPFADGRTRQLARLIIDPHAPPRSYSLMFRGTANIEYSPFPHRLSRAKAAQERALKTLAAADSALKAAVRLHDEASAALKRSEAELQNASETEKPALTEAVETAKKRLAGAESAVEAAATQQARDAASKQAAETALADVVKVSAPRKIDCTSPSTPVTLTVVPAPVELSVHAASDGRVQRGGTLDVTVTARRREGFDGPIHCMLALLPETQGLTAEPVTIAAGTNEAVLRVAAGETAREGDVPFSAIRVEADREGGVRIDVPVFLSVVP